jgi:hypothetical protein
MHADHKSNANLLVCFTEGGGPFGNGDAPPEIELQQAMIVDYRP